MAGSEHKGYADGGVGSVARFNWVLGLACVEGGDRLYAADCANSRVRMIDIKTGRVSTPCETRMEEARKIVFDRSVNCKPESVAYITVDRGVMRWEVDTNTATGIKWSDRALNMQIDPSAIANLSSASGLLIISCMNTDSIYEFDPNTGDAQLLAGCGKKSSAFGRSLHTFADGSGIEARFYRVFDFVVNDCERHAYVIDNGFNRVRRMTLPDRLF